MARWMLLWSCSSSFAVVSYPLLPGVPVLELINGFLSPEDNPHRSLDLTISPVFLQAQQHHHPSPRTITIPSQRNSSSFHHSYSRLTFVGKRAQKYCDLNGKNVGGNRSGYGNSSSNGDSNHSRNLIGSYKLLSFDAISSCLALAFCFLLILAIGFVGKLVAHFWTNRSLFSSNSHHHHSSSQNGSSARSITSYSDWILSLSIVLALGLGLRQLTCPVESFSSLFTSHSYDFLVNNVDYGMQL